MTATQFICPNRDKILIKQCLSTCPHCLRCMAKPTLETLARSVADRGLGRKYSVTELIAGTREQYLKKTTEYAIDPQAHIFAIFSILKLISQITLCSRSTFFCHVYIISNYLITIFLRRILIAFFI